MLRHGHVAEHQHRGAQQDPALTGGEAPRTEPDQQGGGDQDEHPHGQPPTMGRSHRGTAEFFPLSRTAGGVSSRSTAARMVSTGVFPARTTNSTLENRSTTRSARP